MPQSSGYHDMIWYDMIWNDDKWELSV
jgi:hypothetical protein